MGKKVLINIGRQFGSGGKSVAIALGEKLGIPVYDNELIEKAAEASGFSPEIFRKSDERKHLISIGNIFGSNRYGNSTLTSGISESDLFKIQSETIREIASKESAIFVGRASDYVLRDMECLDVFVTAPLEDRIARIMERRGLDRGDAEKSIKRHDRARKEYYDFFSFGDNWGVASNYDLCVDSSILGIEGTADYIIEFGRKAGLI